MAGGAGLGGHTRHAKQLGAHNLHLIGTTLALLRGSQNETQASMSLRRLSNWWLFM